MTRPSNEAEYLARMVPPSVRGVDRRTLLRGALGVGALLGAGGLAACSSGSTQHRRPDRRRHRHRHGRLQPVGPRAEGRRPVLHGRLRQGEPRHDGQDQHRRPQLLPGEHQQLPAGLAGRRLHVVRRLPHAVLRREGPRRRPLRRLEEHHRHERRPQEGLDRRRRQAVLRADHELPVGGLLPQERLQGQGLPGPQDPRRAQRARRADEEGRPRPDRLRRQGRLARDGHLRPDQPARQRLRLPRQPDGRQGGLDRPQGQEGLRHLGRHPAAPPGRLARSHVAGGGAVAPAEEVGHVRPRLVRRPAVRQGRRAGRPRLLRLPRDRLDDRHRRRRGPDRRLHDERQAEERGGRQEAAPATSPSPRPSCSPSRPTRASSRRTARPTRAATPPCRRSRPSSSSPPSRSRSSWTATPAPTSPRR